MWFYDEGLSLGLGRRGMHVDSVHRAEEEATNYNRKRNRRKAPQHAHAPTVVPHREIHFPAIVKLLSE